MKLRELGELELITRLFNIYSRGTDTKSNLFPYDDCAVLDFGTHYILLTTDLVSEHTHIPRGTSGFQLGWFLMAINLSDLAAKGAVPVGFLNAMALPPELEVEFIDEVGEGLAACSRAYRTPIIGGDTKSSPEMILTGMAVGQVPKNYFMSRKGCKPEDILAVTGELGRAGYALRELEKLPDGEDNSETRKLLLDLVLEVKPQLWAGQLLGNLGYCHSSIDLSDGLGIALHQLAERNQVGFSVDLEKLPTVPMLKDIEEELSDEEYEDMMLYAGGDYELLIAFNPAYLDTVQSALKQLGVNLTVIGDVLYDQELVVRTKDTEKPLENKGFDHFK
ncbi:MAG: thiamine-phosphate kinase [Thermoplasmata archaeon]|nr:MAG: thiamine-phosphate kinase [Thermoplasmata archaeon]